MCESPDSRKSLSSDASELQPVRISSTRVNMLLGRQNRRHVLINHSKCLVFKCQRRPWQRYYRTQGYHRRHEGPCPPIFKEGTEPPLNIQGDVGTCMLHDILMSLVHGVWPAHGTRTSHVACMWHINTSRGMRTWLGHVTWCQPPQSQGKPVCLMEPKAVDSDKLPRALVRSESHSPGVQGVPLLAAIAFRGGKTYLIANHYVMKAWDIGLSRDH